MLNTASILTDLKTDLRDPDCEPDPLTCDECKVNSVPWFWNLGRSSRPNSRQYFEPCWMNPRTCAACNEKKKLKQNDDPMLRLKNSGIPDRYNSLTTYNPCLQAKGEDWDAFRARIPWGILGVPLLSRDDYMGAIGWQPDNGWMLIEGRPGTGKTAVACAVVSTLLLEPQRIGRALSAIYESESGIYDAIRQSKHLDPDQRNIAREARTTGILIIDDLGSSNETPGWCKDVLQSIIMHRYDKRLPTICTTNLTTQNLEKMYGERTVSRIMDSVGPMHLKFNNETWRSSGLKVQTVSRMQNKSGF